MIRHVAAPLSEQIFYDLIIPPVGTAIWWLLSRGWAATVQGGSVSETTKRRQKIEFFVILIAAYVLMFSITIYGNLTR